MSTPQLPLSAIRQPAFVYGPDGRIAAANDRAEVLAGRPLAGCSAADAIGIFDIRSPDGAPLDTAALPVSGALRGEVVVDVPLAIAAPDGRTVRVLATASPIRNSDTVAGALVVWQEVPIREHADGAERGLHRHLLDAILGALPYTVSLWDRNERIVWANERFAAEHGEDREALIGRSWRDLGAPLDVVEPLFREALGAVRIGATVTREVAVAGTDGGEWRACTFLPFGRDEVLVITADVSERRRAEQDLAFQALLLDRMNDAVVATDTDLRVTAWNRAAEALYGWSADEAIGRPESEVTGTVTTGTERQEQLARLARGEAVPPRVRQHHREGRPLTVEGRSAPIHDSSGTLLGYVAVNRDVTEQERLRDELTASEAKYRRLFETMTEGFVLVEPILDEQGAPVSFRHLEVNPAKERIAGLSRDELVGRDVRELVPDMEEYWIETYGRVALTGEPAHLEAYASSLGVWLSVDAYSPGPGTAAVVVSDVTKRKEAELALAESEAMYRSLVENSIDAVLLTEPDGTICSANPEACRIFGMTEEELVRAGRDAVVDLTDPRLGPAVEERLRNGKFRGELRFRRKDGSVFPVEVSTALFTDRDGALKTTITILDVTDRKAAMDALRTSEEKFRTLYEHSLDAIVLADPLDGGRILSANPAACRMLGHDEEDLVGRGPEAMIDPDDPRAAAMLRERSHDGAACTELTFRRRDGSTFPGEVGTALFTDCRGEERAVAIIRDVTERNRIERELARYADDLRDSRQQLADVIEATGAGYYHMATDGADGTISRRGAELLGVLPHETPRFPELGPWALRRVHPGDLAALSGSFAAFVAGEGERNVAEFRVPNRDGGYRWIQAISTCVRRDEDGRVATLAGFLFDIDERKRAEAALVQSNEELQRFAYVASHDLQEPLRSIVNFSQLLDRRYRGRLDADADEFIGFIVEGGIRMQALIQDLLQISRLETQARPAEPTDAGAVVYVALRALEASIRATGARVTVEALPAVMVDWTQLEQVFANLVGNALKYRHPGVPPRIRISAEERGRMVEFAVADNGIGIEAEYFDRIFEMFRRLHTHDEYEGTGIGLAVVKRIVERHGGRVRVASTPGEGSTFFFSLPAA